MPELPEVETIRRTLEPCVVGRAVRDVKLRRRDVVHAAGNSEATWIRRGGPQRVRPRTPPLLQGEVICRLDRRGKQLAIVSEGGPVLVVHLGMTGQLTCVGAHEEPTERTHIHVEWTLDDGSRLLFRDPRRFGGVGSFPDRAALARAWEALGPDAAAIDAGTLRERLAHTRRAIKAALMDQAVVAGIGNIYADETLFEARIRPRRIASRLGDEEIRSLAMAIRAVLAQAIEARGSSLRDYVDGTGRIGGFQLRHRVYGRGGKPCAQCGNDLRHGTVAQRTTVWCPRCQK